MREQDKPATQPQLTPIRVLQTAQLAHEVNRAYCKALGDHSQVEWRDAPDWQQNSAIEGVEFVLANPKASASASHDNWLAQKIADGWVHGPEKDPAKKVHPCCVPYDELPLEQRVKDYLFRAVVLTAAAQ